MFDSPSDYCPVCREVVLLDQTQRKCAAEHHCNGEASCPLARCFSGYGFSVNHKTGKPDDRLA